jgi:SWI/SNF-related matrix-associated actin-dependent regulator 1 of chromatin subfamily A
MQILVDPGSKAFYARADYEERTVLKSAGFRWDPVLRRWWTSNADVVARLDPAAVSAQASEALSAALAGREAQMAAAAAAREARIAAEAAAREASLSASRAADAAVEIPHPAGRAYMPFQRAGIAYALSRPATLIGDEMGLGKTIQALGVINADPAIERVLVVCPLSVALNWEREAATWLARPLSVGVATGKQWPDTQIVVAHWGLVAKHAAALRAQPWDLIVLDEAHYAKNPKAARTKAVFGDRQAGLAPLQAARKLALTGTPIPNRPVEAWPVVHWLAPAEFRSWREYVGRYCGATEGRWGWDANGATHLDELQERLRSTVMVRRRKADVLQDLPAKARQVVVVPADTPELRRALSAERATEARHAEALARAQAAVELAKAAADAEAYRAAVEALRTTGATAFTEVSTARHDTARAKLPQVIAHVRDVLEEGGKVVVFGHHRDVLGEIQTALESGDREHEGVKTAPLWGGMDAEARQAAVDQFQVDPAIRVFLGSIGAAREGITLTAASTAVFAELDWVPGNLSQAEDRIHRIGQRDACLVQHVLLDGSLDAKMAQTILEKQGVLDAALDVQHQRGERLDYQTHDTEQGAEALVAGAGQPAATHGTSRAQIAERAARMTPADIARVHEGLRMLAGLDADYARTRNGAGFSKVDAAIGHDLAERDTLTPRQGALGAKLLAKYHRQIDPSIAGVWQALGGRTARVPVHSGPNHGHDR